MTLEFVTKRENAILVVAQGLGKTMLAKNLVHEAVLAGHSARFITAADLILDLTAQDTARGLHRRLRPTHERPYCALTKSATSPMTRMRPTCCFRL